MTWQNLHVKFLLLRNFVQCKNCPGILGSGRSPRGSPLYAQQKNTVLAPKAHKDAPGLQLVVTNCHFCGHSCPLRSQSLEGVSDALLPQGRNELITRRSLCLRERGTSRCAIASLDHKTPEDSFNGFACGGSRETWRPRLQCRPDETSEALNKRDAFLVSWGGEDTSTSPPP